MASFRTFRLVPENDGEIDENDDWTGLKDSKERRRRQNRLNQRALRRRQRLGLMKEQELKDDDESTESMACSFPPSAQFHHQLTIQSKPDATTSAAIYAAPCSAASSTSSALSTCSDDTHFPLTRDHQLLHIIGLNVSRAIVTNYLIIRTIIPPADDCCSGRRTLALSNATVVPSNIDGTLALPPSLIPTKLQEQVPHPAWIDLFPSAQMRDNLILALEEYNIDEEDLLMDLTGNIFEDFHCTPADEETCNMITDGNGTPALEEYIKSGEMGVVSWSDPWDVSGWELTDRFVSKWGFLLQGCSDVIVAANNWRSLRGEDPLVVEI